MILASYAWLHDEDTSDDIHVHDRTAVYRMDNKIFPWDFPYLQRERFVEAC